MDMNLISLLQTVVPHKDLFWDPFYFDHIKITLINQ